MPETRVREGVGVGGVVFIVSSTSAESRRKEDGLEDDRDACPVFVVFATIP